MMRRWLIGVSGLFLAACAAGPQPDAITATNGAEPSALADAPADEIAAPPRPTVYVDAYRPPDPAQILGMPQSEVRSLLGEPGTVRRELTAEVWQYRQPGCVLDLFLYLSPQPDTREVIYYELRDVRNGDELRPMAARYCFAHFLQT